MTLSSSECSPDYSDPYSRCFDSLNQLPYLDSKHEYLWGSRVAEEVADTSAPTLHADKPYTVRLLTGKLLELARGGMDDAGFPVLVRDTSIPERIRDEDRGRDNVRHVGKERARDKGGLRLLGFVGVNELEHALCELPVGATLHPLDSLRIQPFSQMSLTLALTWFPTRSPA